MGPATSHRHHSVKWKGDTHMISDMETETIERWLYQNEERCFRHHKGILAAKITLDTNCVERYILFGQDHTNDHKTLESIIRDIFSRICMETSRRQFVETFRSQTFFELYRKRKNRITQELKLRGMDGMLIQIELCARIIKDPYTSHLNVYLYGWDDGKRKKLELSCQISIKKSDLFYTEIGMEALMENILQQDHEREEHLMILLDIDVGPQKDLRLIEELDHALYQDLKEVMIFSKMKDGKQMLFQYRMMDRSEVMRILKQWRKQVQESLDGTYPIRLTTVLQSVSHDSYHFEAMKQRSFHILKEALEKGGNKDILDTKEPLNGNEEIDHRKIDADKRTQDIGRYQDGMKKAIHMVIREKDSGNTLYLLLKELCHCSGASHVGIFLQKVGYLRSSSLAYPKPYMRQNKGMRYQLKNKDEDIGYLEIYGIESKEEQKDMIRFFVSLCNLCLLKNHIDLKETYLLTHDMRSNARNLMSMYAAIDDIREETISSAGVICIGILNTETKEPRLIYESMKELVRKLRRLFQDHEIYQLRGDRLLILVLEYSKKEFEQQCEQLKEILSDHQISESFFRNDQIDIMDMITQVMLLTDSTTRKYQREGQGHHARYRQMSDELKNDIKNGNYRIFLQPKADLNGNVKGAEALIRCWKDGKVIPPSSFVDRFEALDLIGELDLFVFEEVCRLQKLWQSKGIELPVSFNFSRMTLIDKDLMRKLETILDRYEVNKESLEIEITETVGNISAEIIDDIANKMVEQGYRLSLDDFGARYSNLSILAEVAFHTLKLDKDIIDDIHMNPKVKNIVRSVIQVCHDMGIQVVAEGVERPEQMVILKELHCDLVQGYFINKPIPVPAFVKQYLKDK